MAVSPPTANFAAPSRNSRRLIPPWTYWSKRLRSSWSKSLALFCSINRGSFATRLYGDRRHEPTNEWVERATEDLLVRQRRGLRSDKSFEPVGQRTLQRLSLIIGYTVQRQPNTETVGVSPGLHLNEQESVVEPFAAASQVYRVGDHLDYHRVARPVCAFLPRRRRLRGHEPAGAEQLLPGFGFGERDPAPIPNHSAWAPGVPLQVVLEVEEKIPPAGLHRIDALCPIVIGTEPRAHQTQDRASSSPFERELDGDFLIGGLVLTLIVSAFTRRKRPAASAN